MKAAEIAADWIAYWKHHELTGEFRKREEGFDDFDLPRDQPELCWETILTILEQLPADPEDGLFGVLAAGMMEDLLRNHGPEFIERVEAEAEREPKFNLLLGGVWLTRMSEEVRDRVEACRREVW